MIDFIAEIGSNYVVKNRPSKERALKLIEEAARNGATTVKFQLIKAEELYRDKSMVDALKPMELPVEWIPELYQKCNQLGVEFLCSPFYLEAVDILMPYVDRWKIASWELTDVGQINPLIKKIADTEMPVVVSTAGATFEEVDFTLNVLRPNDEVPDDVILLHCNPSYPTNSENAELKRVLDLASEFYPLQVGFSCHVANPIVAAASVMYEAETIEVHFDLEDKLGSEGGHSLSPSQFAEMVRMANVMQLAKKGCASESDINMARKMYRRDSTDWLRGVK